MIEVDYILCSFGKMFYKKGTAMLHREDGPAIEYFIGNSHRWYYKGEYIECHSQKEFEKKLKLLAFI